MEFKIAKDLITLELEIDFYKQQVNTSFYEIGFRLIEAKKQVLHGEWYEWLRKRQISPEWARRFMKCASNPTPDLDLDFSKAYLLSSIDEEMKNEIIEQLDVELISKRELEEEIKKRKQLEIQNHALQETLAHVQSSKPEVIEKEVVKEIVKEVIPDDYEELKRKYESKSLLEKQIKSLEEEIYKKDSKILSLQIAQREALNKLPQTEKEKKLLDDSLSFVWAVNDFLKKVGGLVYLTQQISDLPTHERNRYISAIENVWGWSNQTKFNLEEVIKNEK